MNQFVNNAQALRLHIPEPQCRPGDAPDFGALRLPPAGGLPRPGFTADESTLRHLPYALIRVLDDDDAAVGEWRPNLGLERLCEGLRAMMLTRAFDEAMQRAQRKGKASFFIKSTGEEAVAVAQAYALDARDMLFPSYRQQGLLIARGWPIEQMMCQILSNSGDQLKGRQLPTMYSAREAGVFSLSGNLGTQFPQAVGWAMASALRGDTRIAASWVGDGTTAEADFHHALTFASVYRAPVILNVVNNQWAISSFAGIAGGERATFAARAIGYGMAGLRVDGNDFLAVHAATQWAAERARANAGATLIELYTYRAAAHSTSDDPSAYRPREEAAQWPLGDPIERLKRHLIRCEAWSESRQQALQQEVDEQVRAALRQAESLGVIGDTRIERDSLFDDVYKTLPAHLQAQREQLRKEG